MLRIITLVALFLVISFQEQVQAETTTGIVYLQTRSTSQNISYTHLLNTSDENQQFLGTLFRSDGFQLGEQDQPLHIDEVPTKGRLVISSEDIETAFRIDPWLGPAMLEVKGTGTFELMTKLTSPSGLVSNTNCCLLYTSPSPRD